MCYSRGEEGGIRLKWGECGPEGGGGEWKGQGARLNKTFMSIPQSGSTPPQNMPFVLCPPHIVAVDEIVVDSGLEGGFTNAKSATNWFLLSAHCSL